MEFNTILFEVEENIAFITFNRPKVLNAVDARTVDDLSAVVAEVERGAARALVLTGAGEKAFVAGADIGELSKLDGLGGVRTGRKGQHLMFQIEWCPKPVIAAVMGERVTLVDSAAETARQVAATVAATGLARPHPGGRTSFFVTDVPDRFIRVGQRFLGSRVESAVRIER